ncbi:MAG TPA: 3-keto-5-aminohexanoate cleavage protein [Pyrinomonadaceae bacterium]|nr:3-keto-5-aminohexanoate cleavage protein [Pyrinomonadaceae bacterium]
MARFEAISAWNVLPDFASVNFGERGAVKLARLLLSRGVDVEAGLCDAKAADVFLESGLGQSCLRILIEPQEQELADALATVSAIEKSLGIGLRQPLGMPPILLHGTEATVWPMMDEAITRGYDVRVGLEDTLCRPDGTTVRDNAELVAAAILRVNQVKRRAEDER